MRTGTSNRRLHLPTIQVGFARRKIEEALAGRVGGDRKSSSNTLLLENGQSRDIAADVGMSGEQYYGMVLVALLMVPPQTPQNEADRLCRAWHHGQDTRV